MSSSRCHDGQFAPLHGAPVDRKTAATVIVAALRAPGDEPARDDPTARLIELGPLPAAAIKALIEQHVLGTVRRSSSGARARAGFCSST